MPTRIVEILQSMALILSLTAAVATMASESSPAPITTDSVSLSGTVFLKSFASKTESERSAASLYFLGVLDATEGKDWCDFKTLKTVTLREFVYEYMRKLNENRMNERASLLIAEALHKSFPCKGRKQ
jgi:hypothetical protein